jgi:hypothetical protein
MHFLRFVGGGQENKGHNPTELVRYGVFVLMVLFE